MSRDKKHNFKFKHSLGQNFITDEFLLEDIADESGITKDDLILEIGPGNGALTRCLCDRAKYVVIVEIDKSLIPLLKSNLKEYNNVSIINADFLKFNFQNIINEFLSISDFRPIKVVANLPYYITSPIIQNLLQNPYICEMTLMVQKEVAERIVATPNNKDFGVLTLACNYFAETEMIMLVSKECFYPKPKVDSAVVHFKKFPQFVYDKLDSHITDNTNNQIIQSDEKLFKLIKASFAERRKKLLNSLSNAGYDKNSLATAFSKLGFDENVRAENLSLDDYKNLLNIL
ncbi:MAG: ribosomal RNA small subunit methyltransferase A [Lachnospiraceae bacterium]|nr:ribosomal RNA small subunit methyltransferase A [Lachnospiraceae bacterium]